MTTVYRARDVVLDRMVALKVLAQGADETTRERFRREARTAAMLEHPNIVRIYQVGQMPDSGLSYIAMELVNGPSLSQFLEKHPVLSPHDTVVLLEPIARALAYAHARGVIHRDVKPSNILLNPVSDEHPLKLVVAGAERPLTPLLSDFGIAQALDAPELTAEGRTIGTPAFMSPEQSAGSDELDGRSDIYALGAVLYRCVVGHPPYRGSTTQILHAHVYDPLLIPKEATERIPASIISIVQRAMAKQPSERYQTAMQMADDLSAAARSLSMDAGATTLAAAPYATQYPTSQQASTPSYILVPAREASPNTTTYAAPSTSVPLAEPATSTSTSEAAPVSDRQRSRLALLLGIALVIATILVFVALFSVILPSLNIAGRSSSSTPTAVAMNTVADTNIEDEETNPDELGTNQPAVSTADAGSDGSDNVITLIPDAIETGSETGLTTPAPGSANPDGTQQAQQTPQSTVTTALNVSPQFAWRQVQTFFAEQDWTEARTWLIALQRAMLDDDSQAEEIDPAIVDRMLIESTVWLAAQAFVEGDYESAAEFGAKASEISDAPNELDELSSATKALADASADEQDDAIAAVQAAFFALSPYLDQGEQYCNASEMLGAVAQVREGDQFATQLAEFDTACAIKEAEDQMASVEGRILYSANEGEKYSIYQARLGGSAAPSLLIEDGSQPSLSPDYETIAFYSWRPDLKGLVAAPMSLRSRADDGRILLTDFVEDSRDSPPSWNPQSDRVAYSSTNFGDGRSRLYLTWANGSRETYELGLGKDPAWHPQEDLIVFNGTDETGNNPGLWMMRTDGTQRRQLTANGNDQRPVWLPDGSGIVFMSNGRDANWEIYRYDFADDSVTRLTANLAQDGLPAVSPDGSMIAFMTDRAGYWELWLTPVAGGDAVQLAEITGELPRWLEHSIQWVQ